MTRRASTPTEILIVTAWMACVGACAADAPNHADAAAAPPLVEDDDALTRAVAELSLAPGFAYDYYHHTASTSENPWSTSSLGSYSVRRTEADSAIEVALVREGEQAFVRRGATFDAYNFRTRQHHRSTFADSAGLASRGFDLEAGILANFDQVPGVMQLLRDYDYRLDSVTRGAADQRIEVYRIDPSGASLPEFLRDELRHFVYVDPSANRIVRTLRQQVDSAGAAVMNSISEFSNYRVPGDDAFLPPAADSLERFEWALPEQARERAEALQAAARGSASPRLEPGAEVPHVPVYRLDGTRATLPRRNAVIMVGGTTCGYCTAALRTLDTLSGLPLPDGRDFAYVTRIDGPVRVADYLRRYFGNDLGIPVYVTRGHDAEALGNTPVPLFVETDAAGRVTRTHVGYDRDYLERLVEGGH